MIIIDDNILRPMSCPYCGLQVSATLCQKYYAHVGLCRQLYEANTKATHKEQQLKQAHQENQKMHQTMIATWQLEHATKDAREVLEAVRRLDIFDFNTPERLSYRLQEIRSYKNNMIDYALESDDSSERCAAWIFLTKVMMIFKTRLAKESPFNLIAKETAERLCRDCYSKTTT